MKMGFKCSVAGCPSKSKFPTHKLPMDESKANEWLRAIQRSDLIGASKNMLAKVRICFEHFPEDMIVTYTQRRRLKENAIPTLHLVEQHTSSTSIINTELNMENVAANVSEDVQSCSNLVPAEVKNTPYFRDLRKKLRKCKIQLYKKKRTISRQRQQIKKQKRQTKNKWKDLTADLSGVQKTFIEMISKNFDSLPQITDMTKMTTKCQQGYTLCKLHNGIYTHVKLQLGHRYEANHKAVALTLYKTMGKRAYKCLRNIFQHLPSIQTLQSALLKIPIATGLSTFILRHLKNISSKMSEQEKVCILMWDEVSIQPKTSYDRHKDVICGLEDWGNNRTGKVADHALVFMLRGLKSGWKMPVSYSFCNKQTNTAQLVRCIKEHITKLCDIGFHIVATVCDQGSSNVAAINELLLRTDMLRNFEERTQSQTFEVGKATIVPLYDPPHLTKGLRNNMLTKDLAVECDKGGPAQIVSWNVIKTAWLIDKKLNTIRPILKKLTKEHVIENKIKKMRVKHATQVFSGTMASCIETLTRLKCAVSINEEIISIPAEGLATAETVNFFNDLFDSVNGSNNHDNELRCPVTESSAHHTFWVNAKQKLRNMRYVTKCTHETLPTVPTVKNWLFTIDGFQKLWKLLHQNFDFKNLKPRYCNQDPLENLFGQIRSHAVRHINPTPQQFEHSFVTILVSNIKSVSIISGNCEITKDDSMLLSLEECLQNVSNDKMYDVDCNNEICDEPHEIFNDTVTEDDIADAMLEERVLEKIYDEPQEMFTDKVVPEDDIVALTSDEISLEDIICATAKQFNQCQECLNSLRSREFPICARSIICTFSKLLRTRCHRRNILKILLLHFDDWYINMDWYECMEHQSNIFKTLVRIIGIKVLVCWCNRKNNIICNDSEESLRCEREYTENIVQLKRIRNSYNKSRNERKRTLQNYKKAIRIKK